MGEFMKPGIGYNKWIRDEISEAQLTINFCRSLLHNKDEPIKIVKSHLGYIVPNPSKIKGFKYVYNYRQFYFKNNLVCEDLNRKVEYTNICVLLHDLKEYKKYLDRTWAQYVILAGGKI